MTIAEVVHTEGVLGSTLALAVTSLYRVVMEGDSTSTFFPCLKYYLSSDQTRNEMADIAFKGGMASLESVAFAMCYLVNCALGNYKHSVALIIPC